MPTGLATRPLTRLEISQVLQGMADTPPSEIPSHVSLAAFWCTLEGLTHWCKQSDVDAAARSIIDRWTFPITSHPVASA